MTVKKIVCHKIVTIMNATSLQELVHLAKKGITEAICVIKHVRLDVSGQIVILILEHAQLVVAQAIQETNAA